MLRVLEQLGYDLDALLASAGLRRHDVADPDASLRSRACATVFENAHRERRVRNLALQARSAYAGRREPAARLSDRQFRWDKASNA